MRLIRMLLLPALALTAVSAHADPASVASLKNLLDKSQTLTARFSQLTLDAGGTQLQETAGEMAVQRPGLFYWHTEGKSEQTIVS
ncbi:outer-membrane lipoprotein carrier protein LolA, partial [Pseudomonas sp. SIMBA_067]